MKHTRLTLLTLLVAGLSGSSLAGQRPSPIDFSRPANQPGVVRADTMHLTVLSSISATDITAGTQLSLAFAVTPKKLMHVYAPGKHEYQVIGLRLDPQPWLQVQPVKYPPSEIYHFKELDEKVETYGQPFKLVQDITILATPEARKLLAASPTLKLSGRLEYQACDDKVCYAPTRVPVSFTLNVTPSPAK